MANTASRLPQEDRPDFTPEALRRRENPNTSSTGAGSGGSSQGTRSSAGGSSQGTRSSSGGSSQDTGPGLYNPSDLKDREESAGQDDEDNEEDDQLGKGYTGKSNSTTKSRFKITRRRAAAGGGLGGVLIAVILGGATVTQGPLEIIHFAQLMEKFHFSSQQDAQDGRLMRIARFIRDPSRPENTRMGIVGNYTANKLEAKIHEATGFKPVYENGQSKGWRIDREHPDFKDLKTNQIKDKLASQGIDRSTIIVENTSDGRQSITVDPERNIKSFRQPVKAYRSQTKFARVLLKRAGLSELSTHAGARVLRTRAGWTFHPVQKLDTQIRSQLLKGVKGAKDKVKKQFASDQVKTEAGVSVERPGGRATSGTQTDSSGNTTTNPNAEANSKGVGDVADEAAKVDPTDPATEKDFKDKLKAKAGASVATGIGIGCLIQGLSKNIDQERQAKVVLPMMRKAGQLISLGSQIQSGQDISAEQVGLFKDFLNKKDANGKVVSSWNQAQSIQAEEGHPENNQYDIPPEGQVANKGNPFDFLDHVPLLSQACGVLSSTFGQIFAIVTGPVSTIVSGQVLDKALPLLAHWLSGEPISPVAAGADYGNYVNYGSRYSANDQYASVGGAQMGSADELALKTVNNELDNQDFQSKNIAYRLFNPNDSQTLAAHLIDNYGSSATAQSTASLIHNFGSIFTNALRVPASLLSGVTKAAPSSYNYHGLKKVGFTTAELADTRVENPFQNACAVAGGDGCSSPGILSDSAKYQQYSDLAKKCFGAEIGPGPEFNVNSKTSSINFDGPDYPSDCKRSGDEDWFRVRFYLLDTATIEAYDCTTDSQSSDQSCSDVGFDSSATKNTSNNTSTSDISAYKNPLRDVMKNGSLFPRRIDEGVDYGGHGPIYAMGNGTVTFAGTGLWFAAYGQSVVYTLSDGPAAGKSVYFSESCTPTVHSGDKVTPDTVICNMHGDDSPWTETGWAVGTAAAQDTPSASVGYNECATVYGVNYSDLLKKLGSPPGKVECGGPDEKLPAGWPKW